MDYTKTLYPDYPVFFGNTPCSATYALEKSDIRGMYRGKSCLESNCPQTQREKCGTAYRVPALSEIESAANKMGIDLADIDLNDERVVVRGEVESGKLVYLRYALRFPVVSESVGYAAGYNWSNVRDEGRIIEVPWRDNWVSK